MIENYTKINRQLFINKWLDLHTSVFKISFEPCMNIRCVIVLKFAFNSSQI